MAARQFGHCSSDAVAIGRTAPHAAHRETVCLASMPPPRGASAGGRGGGDGVRGSGFELRYPCWRYLRSLMAGKCIVGGVPSPGSASLAAQSSFWSIPGMCATIPVLLTYLAATRLVAAPRVVSIVVSVLVGAASRRLSPPRALAVAWPAGGGGLRCPRHEGRAPALGARSRVRDRRGRDDSARLHHVRRHRLHPLDDGRAGPPAHA